MIPPLRDTLARPLQPLRLPSLTWGYIQTMDGETSRLNGHVDGLEAVRQDVHAICHTERGSVLFMEHDDGIELEQFIGRSYGYFLAKIENVFRDALLRDDRIRSIEFLEKSRPWPTVATARIRVYSIYGPFEESFDIALAR